MDKADEEYRKIKTKLKVYLITKTFGLTVGLCRRGDHYLRFTTILLNTILLTSEKKLKPL